MSEEANGSVVRITNQMIYAEVQALQRDMADIKAAVARIDDHEMRLRSVEVWKNAIPVALIFGVVSIVLAILRAA